MIDKLIERQKAWTARRDSKARVRKEKLHKGRDGKQREKGKNRESERGIATWERAKTHKVWLQRSS